MADAKETAEPGAVATMMRPRSVAVIGVSARPGSAGYNAFMNLAQGGFAGELYAVGRSGGTIEGHTCLTSIEDLPEGIDLAIFTLPAAAVHDALAACAARKVRSAVIFAAGFSEVGGTGHNTQQAISATARAGGLSLLGPNCLGYSNLVTGLSVGFFGGMGGRSRTYEGREGIAHVGQSGLLVAHIRAALEARKLPSSYFVTTGNEAGLTLADFVDFFASDPSTKAIAVFAEHIRAPTAFLAAAAKARAAGKTITLLHTGKSERAKVTARSHTGALAGDYTAMRTAVEHAGIAVVDTIEELIDVTELLARFPTPPTKGVGVVSFSGAFCGQTHDYCADLGLDVPPLSPEIVEEMRPQVPDFAPPANPLDLTTQPAWQPELLGIGTKALLDDPAIGSVVIGTPIGAGPQSSPYLDGLLPRLEGNTKPIVWGAMSEGQMPGPEFLERMWATNLPFIPSPERALRAIAKLTAHGKRSARMRGTVQPTSFAALPTLGTGNQPEWLGKTLLAAAGIAIPQGVLARSLEDANVIAASIGYPIVIKAQAKELAHKTEAGGVIVGIRDAEQLARAWGALHASVERARPGIELEGVLVEVALSKGTELIVGARRDPDWGPLLVVGLGGIWAEAFRDVRTMPPDLAPEAIVEELYTLKAAPLFRGFRDRPALDVEAVATVASRLGQLMLTQPEIEEIEVNPLIVHAQGEGATALDALVITSES